MGIGGISGGGGPRIDVEEVGRADEKRTEIVEEFDADVARLKEIFDKWDSTIVVGGKEYDNLRFKKITRSAATEANYARKAELFQIKQGMMMQGNMDAQQIMKIDAEIKQIDALITKKVEDVERVSDEEFKANYEAALSKLDAEKQAEIAEARQWDPKYMSNVEYIEYMEKIGA